LHLGVQMKLSSLLGVLVSIFSFNVLAVYGGISLPSVMKGSPRVIRIETSFICSAVVVNSQTLLTAAHCTEELELGDKIRLVQPDNNDSSKNRVRSVIRHPDYRMGFGENSTIDKVYADIAIIKLAQLISFPHAGVELATGYDLQHLSQFDVWLVANGSNAHQDTSANSGLPILLRSHPYQILESESLQSQSGPCANDSGGGYFVLDGNRVRLIGIQSSKNSTPSCGSSQSRGYVVDVPSNLNWILKYLN